MENITLHYLNARDVQALDMTTQVICLSERRLHRLMGEHQTGLNPQLVPRPGLDAGLGVESILRRLRMTGHPDRIWK